MTKRYISPGTQLSEDEKDFLFEAIREYAAAMQDWETANSLYDKLGLEVE